MGQKAIYIDLMTGTIEEVTVSAPTTEGVDIGTYLDIKHTFKNGDVLISELRVPGVKSGSLVPFSCEIDGIQGTLRQNCLIVNTSGVDVSVPIHELRKRTRFRRN